MEIECVGKILENGRILVDPALIEKIRIGEKVKLRIMVPDQERKKEKKELSMAAKRLLKRMENAKPIGLPDDPHELSHSNLAEERMEKKFPCVE